jgi:aminoglycoside phosphotransferase family enzyme
MPIITTTDLETNLYPEVIAEITRADDTITQKAVDTAIQETKMYLNRYDLVQLFGTDTDAPAIDDAYLKSLVRDIACWHLLRLSNAGVDYAVFRTAWQDAIAALKSIMSGQAQPQGWPYADTSVADAPPDGNTISWSSNERRNNFY